MTKLNQPPKFLRDLLEARSPSGYENEARAVIEKHIKAKSDDYCTDSIGNVFATVNPNGGPSLMMAGHIDELGLIIRYIDENGFLYFDTIGGHDRGLISGRRIDILTENGIVKGVTGKRALHLMTVEERKKVPELHLMWIDIGVNNKKEASKLVKVGDAAVYNHGVDMIRGSIANSRAFDDKAGAYTVMETLRRVATKKQLHARVTSVATAQEEIGVRGATTAAHALNPDVAIAVDVGHATDHPDCDKRKYGDYKLSGGPILCRGPNIHPQVYQRLADVAEDKGIPYQLEAEARPTGTDARAIQITRSGIATGLVAIPLRYMHTPCETMDLADIENTIKLLEGFALSLKKGEFQFNSPM
jgi:tetrahedral aminopeptidase